MSASYVARGALLYAYIACAPHLAWRGFTIEAWRGWGAYMALALPGVAMYARANSVQWGPE